MIKTQFSTVVWGDWHLDAFLSFAIPSLLAPKNLQAFAKKHNSQYHIVTSEVGVERLRKSEVFARLQTIMPVRVVTMGSSAFQGNTLQDHIRNQHLRLGEALAAARADAAISIIIAPDVCWGNGSFSRLAELLVSARSVVYVKHARVIDETVRPAILANCGESQGVICLTHREIAALAMNHLHPLFSMYLPDSENSAEHAEYSVWPARGEGFQMRILATDGFVLDHDTEPVYGMRSQQKGSLNNVFFPGPDEISGLSLTSLSKDVDWYFTPRKSDATHTGLWWVAFDHHHNEIISAKTANFIATANTKKLGHEVDRRSERWVRRVHSNRRLARIRQKLRANPLCDYAVVLASATIHCAALYRLVNNSSPMTILVPTSAAWRKEFSATAWAGLLNRKQPSDLTRLVKRHTISGTPEIALFKEKNAKIVEKMTTSDGDNIYLIDRVLKF